MKSEKQLKKIYFQEILFIESMENYVLIHTETSREIVYSTLKHFVEILPEKNFIQVHRSYIVHMNHIKAIEGNMLKIGNYTIPVGRSGRENVFETILSNRIVK